MPLCYVCPFWLYWEWLCQKRWKFRTGRLWKIRHFWFYSTMPSFHRKWMWRKISLYLSGNVMAVVKFHTGLSQKVRKILWGCVFWCKNLSFDYLVLLECVHFDANIYWIRVAVLWNSTVVITLFDRLKFLRNPVPVSIVVFGVINRTQQLLHLKLSPLPNFLTLHPRSPPLNCLTLLLSPSLSNQVALFFGF